MCCGLGILLHIVIYSPHQRHCSEKRSFHFIFPNFLLSCVLFYHHFLAFYPMSKITVTVIFLVDVFKAAENVPSLSKSVSSDAKPFTMHSKLEPWCQKCKKLSNNCEKEKTVVQFLTVIVWYQFLDSGNSRLQFMFPFNWIFLQLWQELYTSPHFPLVHYNTKFDSSCNKSV